MFKGLKKKIILSSIERKKMTQPFDLEAAERHELPDGADINQNNSHFFTANSALGEGETLSIRLGMRNGADYEIFVLYKKGALFLTHEKDSYAPEECPVRFIRIESGKHWRVEFKGNLRNVDTGEVRASEISVDFESDSPVYDFLYHADHFNGMAEAIARERWNKKFFAEIGRNDQRHYEQPGYLKGHMKYGEEVFSLDLPCVRDHSFGRREWDLMNDHIWMLAITETGKVLCYSIVNYPMMKKIYSGYTNVFSDNLETLRDFQTYYYVPSKGKGGDLLHVRCHFPGGKVADVVAHRDANVKCSFAGGKYIFQEGLCEFTINGEKARGTIEYGFNANPQRWDGYTKL